MGNRDRNEAGAFLKQQRTSWATGKIKIPINELETGKTITDIFDVIVGAVTEGIIASALATGMPSAEIIDIYLNLASYILPGRFLRRLWNPVNLFAQKCPNKNLKSLLIDKFGKNTTLADVHQQYGNKTIFLIASLNVSPEPGSQETPALKS